LKAPSQQSDEFIKVFYCHFLISHMQRNGSSERTDRSSAYIFIHLLDNADMGLEHGRSSNQTPASPRMA
jgi:hypothetical protein